MRELFRAEWLPKCLAIGIPEAIFWQSTVRELNPYIEAEKIRQKNADRNNYYLGAYTYHAVFAAIENAFNGKKAKAKYLEKPFSEQQSEEEMENEKKIALTKQLFQKLEIMQMNFERSQSAG